MKNCLTVVTVIFMAFSLAVPVSAQGQNGTWPQCFDYQNPSAPGNLVLQGNVEVSWSAAADQPDCSGIDRYEIYRDDVFIGSTQSTSFSDGPLPDGTYTYKVIAFDKAWPDGNEGAPAVAEYTVGAAPPAPPGGGDGGGGSGGGGGGGGGAVFSQPRRESAPPPVVPQPPALGPAPPEQPEAPEEPVTEGQPETQQPGGIQGLAPADLDITGFIVNNPVQSLFASAAIAIVVLGLLIYRRANR